MGYCIIREEILLIEIFGMIICFGAFITITCYADEDQSEEAKSSNDNSIGFGSHVLGIILIFLCSWLVSANFVTNRMLKGIDIYAVMFFHGLLGLFLALCYLIEDGLQRNDFFIILNYSLMQYSIVIFSCVLDLSCVYFGFVAAQASNLGFVGLISYTAIVYAFLTDLFIFDEKLQVVEMLATTIILITTMGVSIYKIKSEQKNQAK